MALVFWIEVFATDLVPDSLEADAVAMASATGGFFASVVFFFTVDALGADLVVTLFFTGCAVGAAFADFSSAAHVLHDQFHSILQFVSASDTADLCSFGCTVIHPSQWIIFASSSAI